MRKNFFDIINSEIDIKNEYIQLFTQFYELREFDYSLGIHSNYLTVAQLANDNFLKFSRKFKKRIGTFSNFNSYFNFNFYNYRYCNDLNYLISFAEYIYNICNQIKLHVTPIKSMNYITQLMKNTIECMDECNYQLLEKNEIFIFVEKKPEATAVAEIVDDNLAYSTLEYNHFTMKGDLERKKAILKKMADDIELDKINLKEINPKLQSQLFGLLNNFIRHNSDQNEYIKSLSDDELENIYDDIYQMWLLAKLELDNIERKKTVKGILNNCNKAIKSNLN